MKSKSEARNLTIHLCLTNLKSVAVRKNYIYIYIHIEDKE
jgi:rRNA pseudouridine-1189 N-methylase Emg1 (Nep1/Mra1 family)